jgi:hypothetical protein
LEVNNHLDHLAILSDRAMPLNQYISTSISMMISQISGIRYYVNQSWQECLNELNNATQRETTLVPDSNTPPLIFARSSELLAMHLLLIHKKSQEQSVSNRFCFNTYIDKSKFNHRERVVFCLHIH